MAGRLTTRLARHGLFALVVLALSLGAVLLRPEGSSTALWWPAAGASVIGVIASPPQDRRWAVLVVLVASTLGNLLSDTGPLMALGFGVANAAEAGTTGWLLLRHTNDTPRLAGLDDVGTLFGAIVAGASVIAIGVGLLVALLVGDNPLVVGNQVFWSHASAQMLLVPIAMTRRSAVAEARLVETMAQWTILVATTAFVFGPGQQLPLTVMPLVVLVWTAARGTTRTVLVQLLTLGVALTLFTLAGGGPFVLPADSLLAGPVATTGLVQAYLLMCGVVSITLAGTVQERREVLIAANEMALRDELTGVYNRHGLRSTVAAIADEARLHGQSFLVALIDLDGFKEINDAFGHPAGDQVLQTISARLSQAVGTASGVVARLGGDEFVVVIPDVDGNDPTSRWAQVLRGALTEPLRVEDEQLRIGVSVGTVTGDGGTGFDDLLARVDESMYADKARHSILLDDQPSAGVGVRQPPRRGSAADRGPGQPG